MLHIQSQLYDLMRGQKAPLEAVLSFSINFSISIGRKRGRVMQRMREWDSERDGGVRFRGPVKSVALCFMKRVKKGH